VLCFFVLWKIPDDPLKWTNFKQSFLVFGVPFIYYIFFDQIALFWKSGLITLIALFQERLKKEQEEKEYKKKEKAEAHLYTIIKVGTSNVTNFRALTCLHGWWIIFSLWLTYMVCVGCTRRRSCRADWKGYIFW